MEGHLVGADDAHPGGDEGIGLQHSHQLGILPLQVAHELLHTTRAIRHKDVQISFVTGLRVVFTSSRDDFWPKNYHHLPDVEVTCQ